MNKNSIQLIKEHRILARRWVKPLANRGGANLANLGAFTDSFGHVTDW